MLRQDDINTDPPASVDDVDLSENMTSPPPSKSTSERTDSVYQVILYRSLPSRLAATCLISDVDFTTDNDKVLEVSKEVGEILQTILQE